jgi:predicted flap endonuclease-1-like 5' DNA nuclease
MAEKKKPVKKTTAKKAAPKKAAPKKAVAKKVPAKKKAATKKPVAKKITPNGPIPNKKDAPIQDFKAEELISSVSGIAPQTQAVVTQSGVIHANDIKSPKTRKRMLKWFKRN